MIKRIDLDKIAELKNVKHADYILIVNNTHVIIVEEVKGRPKLDDIEQLNNTIAHLHMIHQLKTGSSGNISVIGVIHYYRRSDTMFNKVLTTKTKEVAQKGIKIKAISCKKALNTLINSLTKQ